MKKCGFATSAILYTLLLLFLVLMVGILDNLQNKKTILDALKKDTIQALEHETVTDAILDQIGILNSKIVELEEKDKLIVNQFSDRFHSIQTGRYEFTSSTDLIYTGLNITIPANSYFCITAKQHWSHAKPVSVTISSSSTAAQSVQTEGTGTEYAASTTYCNTISSDTTYYIWAKSSSTGNQNAIYITGFYIDMDENNE